MNVMSRVNFRELRRILHVSLWVMIQNFLSISTWFIFFVYIEHLGERELAVTNIVRSLSGFLFMIVIAFASACSSIVSNMIGAGQADDVRKAIRRCILLAYAILVPLVVVLAAWPHPFISIYTDIPALRDASVASVWVMCFSYIVLIPSNIFFQSVSGTGKTKAAFLLEIAALVVYMAYITVTIFEMRVDVAWAWSSETVYGTTMLLLCAGYLRSNRWRNHAI